MGWCGERDKPPISGAYSCKWTHVTIEQTNGYDFWLRTEPRASRKHIHIACTVHTATAQCTRIWPIFSSARKPLKWNGFIGIIWIYLLALRMCALPVVTIHSQRIPVHTNLATVLAEFGELKVCVSVLGSAFGSGGHACVYAARATDNAGNRVRRHWCWPQAHLSATTAFDHCISYSQPCNYMAIESCGGYTWSAHFAFRTHTEYVSFFLESSQIRNTELKS